MYAAVLSESVFHLLNYIIWNANAKNSLTHLSKHATCFLKLFGFCYTVIGVNCNFDKINNLNFKICGKCLIINFVMA